MSFPPERIQKEIERRLHSDSRLEGSEIYVSTRGEEVELTGTVPSYSARSVALEEARTAPGTTRVIDHLRIRYPDTSPGLSDDEIKQRGYQFIELHPEMNLDQVTINVSNGDVSLDGAVDTYWKKYQVEAVLESLRGVRSIENKITIVPSQSFDDVNIAQEVAHELEKNPKARAQWVDIHVRNGRLKLSGVVPSRTAFDATLESARVVGGVTHINNELKIQDVESSSRHSQ